ncbi:MAG: WD40/YVTN/BNR-like repeat-containing protein [Candidatus Binataceae bacterium]
MDRIARVPRFITAAVAVMALACGGCHREVAMPPLPVRLVTLTDKFFDVWPVSPTRAFIVGDRGKVLLTDDGGLHFRRIDIGTNLAVFAIQMATDKIGYLSGQDGLLMRTDDGGLTWKRLDSRTHLYLFALSFPDARHGFIVGDRAIVLSTADGGRTFLKRQLEKIFPPALADFALPYQEPVLYSTDFVDDDHGWIVGEMGRIWETENGGATWNAEQESLIPQWKRALIPGEDPRFKGFLLPTLFGVSFRNQKQGAACGLEGWVVQTDDGGATWRFVHQAPKPGAPPGTLEPGAPQSPARDPLFSIDLYGGNQGIATGLTGAVLQLQPNGAWAHDPNTPSLPLPLSQARFFDARHGWIVGYATILYTDDGGKTWRFCWG